MLTYLHAYSSTAFPDLILRETVTYKPKFWALWPNSPSNVAVCTSAFCMSGSTARANLELKPSSLEYLNTILNPSQIWWVALNFGNSVKNGSSFPHVLRSHPMFRVATNQGLGIAGQNC